MPDKWLSNGGWNLLVIHVENRRWHHRLYLQSAAVWAFQNDQTHFGLGPLPPKMPRQLGRGHMLWSSCLTRGFVWAPETAVFMMWYLSKHRLKSLITQKVSKQVSGESALKKHACTSGKMCVHSPDFQYKCHSFTLLHAAWLFWTESIGTVGFEHLEFVWIPSLEVSVYTAVSMMRITDQLTRFCFTFLTLATLR